ncbi:MAG: DegT/DnrJ/EryC1/StrS family aminotransferase, partial [Schwartzia sp.]|nr:DegT/DnrJ/EryC1/StrS family aminotransferase [Schwartzia sp. (in: firmicutes)]
MLDANGHTTAKRNIPFSPPDISEAEIREVAAALRSGWITTGPRTKELEKRLADFIGTNRVVCLNSATAAEELNFRVLGVGEGDEVIVPAYTYTATASAAIHVGARVAFIDSRPGSWEMDYDAMEAAINERTKAIVPVDIGGIMCDYERIVQAVEAKKHVFHPFGNTELGTRIQTALGRVAVVADGAHSLGAERNGKKAGAASDFTSFSFHAVKNLTTAEGGATTWRSLEGIDDEEIYHAYQLYSLHGQSKDALAKTKAGAWEYDIVGPWYKCNMTDVAAAIGLRQLDRYPEILQRRREIIEKYDEALGRIGVEHLNHSGETFQSSGHLYLARIPGIDEKRRNAVIEEMGKRGIACNVHYKPLPMMTVYKALDWDIKDFPNAYAYYRNLVSLPLHTRLSDEDIA